MEPKSADLGDDVPFQLGVFLGAMLISQGVCSKTSQVLYLIVEYFIREIRNDLLDNPHIRHVTGMWEAPGPSSRQEACVFFREDHKSCSCWRCGQTKTHWKTQFFFVKRLVGYNTEDRSTQAKCPTNFRVKVMRIHRSMASKSCFSC